MKARWISRVARAPWASGDRIRCSGFRRRRRLLLLAMCWIRSATPVGSALARNWRSFAAMAAMLGRLALLGSGPFCRFLGLLAFALDRHQHFLLARRRPTRFLR